MKINKNLLINAILILLLIIFGYLSITSIIHKRQLQDRIDNLRELYDDKLQEKENELLRINDSLDAVNNDILQKNIKLKEKDSLLSIKDQKIIIKYREKYKEINDASANAVSNELNRVLTGNSIE